MNKALRNFPKPLHVAIYAECGFSARTEVVVQLCEKTNEVLEYALGLEAKSVLVPSMSNVDERMPLSFLRPCVDAINSVIEANELDMPLLDMPGDNMDYHRFIPLTREIAEALNVVISQM